MRRYINHEKWQVSEINGGIVLKGKPTEVKTIFYPELIDTNLLATGETFFNYELHHFDGEGNLVYSKFFLDSSSWGEHFFRYSDSALQYESFYYAITKEKKTVLTRKMISFPVSPGVFKKVLYKYGKQDRVEVEEHPDENTVVRKITSSDGHETATFRYRQNKIMKLEYKVGAATAVDVYHYGDQDFLDSITHTPGNKKEVMINNAFGDPLFYFELEGKDTVRSLRMRYEYDSRNNWISKLEFETPSNAAVGAGKFPGYSLTIREIKY
jgi:hypothetical protein